MDPVKYIFENPALTRRIARWQVLLSEFDIVYVTQKVIKGSTLADYLAQQPLQDYLPMHPEFPDEDIMALFEEKQTHKDIDKWIVCFDGASNALGHGVGAVLVSPDDQCIPFTARLGFDCTNNMAEYEACALGVQAAIDFDVKLLKVHGDSALVIRQLKGEWETRDPKLIPYQTHILRTPIHVSTGPTRGSTVHRVQISRQASVLLRDRGRAGWETVVLRYQTLC